MKSPKEGKPIRDHLEIRIHKTEVRQAKSAQRTTWQSYTNRWQDIGRFDEAKWLDPRLRQNSKQARDW